MKTILFQFPDDTSRDSFLSIMRQLADGLRGDTDQALIESSLRNLRLDPPIRSDDERQVALFVSGEKLWEGHYPEGIRRFQQETSVHRGYVQLKELVAGEWRELQTRPATR